MAVVSTEDGAVMERYVRARKTIASGARDVPVCTT